MKHLISSASFFLLFCLNIIQAQDLQGSWQGSLNIMGARLRLVVHLAKSDSGWTATMDSPDQGAAGIPCGRVRTPDDSLIIEVPIIRGRYLGAYQADSLCFAGVWQQGGLALTLNLRKSDAPVTMSRPQEPKPPFPYRSEEVTIPNEKAGLTLAGTLTLPEGSGPFPVVILLTGSGAQNRDETVFGHRSFWIIADHLSRHGYAVLRCDDRGTAQSSGDIKTATSVDFAGDAAAQVTFLANRKDIDAHKIVIAGHSEGGLIAPMVAAENPDIAGIILLAGPGLKGEDILLAQGELIGRASGQDEASLQRNRHNQEDTFDIIKSTNESEVETRLRETLQAMREKMNAEEQAAFTDQAIELQLKSLASPWFRFFLTYDPAPTLQRVKCPVLALNGELDLQVPADANLAAITAALERGGNKRIELNKIPGLNHLFQTAKTGSVSEYSQIEETFSPKALQLITEWLDKNIK